jgi:CRP/FNR family transcriptional regulator, anaerobic regulatory protein
MLAKTPPAPGRQVRCAKCPLRGMHGFRDFSEDELAFIREFKSGELNAETGATLLLQGTNSAHLYTILSGWAIRYKMLADGRRQILNYALPSDFLGLQGTVFDEMQHSVEALTNMVLCVFPRDQIWTLYSRYPSLAFDVTWLAAREEDAVGEHLLSVGRRTALERSAFLLLYLFVRAEQVGLVRGNKIQFPFTQQHIADTLGMSLVHTNKTLKRLASLKAVRWKDRTFEILDRDALVDIAGYEIAEQKLRPFI